MTTPDRVEELRGAYDDAASFAEHLVTNPGATPDEDIDDALDDADAAFAALRAEIEQPLIESFYLPMNCPNCGRVRVLCYPLERRIKCEKCDATEFFTDDAPVEVAPRETPTCASCGGKKMIRAYGGLGHVIDCPVCASTPDGGTGS